MVQQVLEYPHHMRETNMLLRINTQLEKAVFTHRFEVLYAPDIS